MDERKYPDQRLIAGAMSGTSADGVDIAIVAIRGRGLEMSARLVHHEYLPYDAELKRLIFLSRSGEPIGLGTLAKMGRMISMAYANAANIAFTTAGLSARDLACIAAHGQTLFHEPPSTIQWFDPALVAGEVGCAVVSDFRRADCAAEGQGAPLVPFADYILYRNLTQNRILLNIGGIANITWLPAGGSIEQVIAFDTGPGNCIADHLCRTRDPDGRGYDADGRIADQGTPHGPTISAFIESAYIFKKPPKSTDGPQMLSLFSQCKQIANFDGGFADEVATAIECCTHAVKASVDLLLGTNCEMKWEILAAGGGVRNSYLMNSLKRLFDRPGVSVRALDDQNAAAREAIAFALLGAATLDGVPSNVPSVTGARRAVILGSITPKP